MHQIAVKSTKVANSFEVVSHFSFLGGGESGAQLSIFERSFSY